MSPCLPREYDLAALMGMNSRSDRICRRTQFYPFRKITVKHSSLSALILCCSTFFAACGGSDGTAKNHSGDGDGDTVAGDGDGDSVTGDGDGDSVTGDGDSGSDTPESLSDEICATQISCDLQDVDQATCAGLFALLLSTEQLQGCMDCINRAPEDCDTVQACVLSSCSVAAE